VAVTVYRTQPRCKICSSGKRTEVDTLLEQRARGQKDDKGVKINEAYVLAKMTEWGIPNAKPDNIANHWGKNPDKKHSYYTMALTEEDKAALTEEAQDALDHELKELFESIAPGWWDEPRPLRRDEYLELTLNLSALELKRRARSGAPLGVTVDQALKAIDSATRRNANDATAELLRALGGAVGQHVAQTMLPPKQQAALPQVVEHEPVRREDG